MVAPGETTRGAGLVLTQAWHDWTALQALEARATKAYGTLGYPAETWPSLPAAHLEARAAQQLLWVALWEGALAGFATAVAYRPYFYLEELDVDPEHQRKGIGRRLLETVVSAAPTHDCDRVLLRTFNTAPWTVPFYKQCGFRVIPEPLRPECLDKHIFDESACGFPLADRCTMVRDDLPRTSSLTAPI